MRGTAPAHEDKERQQQQARDAEGPHTGSGEHGVDDRDARLRLQRLAKELRKHLGARRDLDVDALQAAVLQARHAALDVGPVPQQHERQDQRNAHLHTRELAGAWLRLQGGPRARMHEGGYRGASGAPAA